MVFWELVKMQNKYLEKVAMSLSLTPLGKHIAVGAGLGGAYGYGEDKVVNRRKRKSNWRTGISVAKGAIGGGLTGAYIHNIKEILRGPIPGNKYKGGQYRGSTFNHGSVDDHLKSFGAKRSSFTTKAEVNKHMKTHMHKVHPDKPGGSTEAFQKASTLAKAIRESDWFEKLAGFDNIYLEKIASFY
jgi:hypothetical protein